MVGSRKVRAVVIILMAWVIGVSAAGTGWAQPAVSEAPASSTELSGTQVLAAVAAGVGSLFYIPFKALAICPGMALASGASLAVSRENRDTAEYLLRVGCTGTYFITPGMVRGQEEFQGSGDP
ncbi:MAG TPA: hypothetical protein VLM91_00855 [Candidatus Methylomirabilis sp.]|nr:hypothetical protein [Candidatus Methylomirabilis sp.]